MSLEPRNLANGQSNGSLGSSFLRTLPPGLEKLNELALDLRWTWNHAADRLWQMIDHWTWAVTHNPWFMLQTVSDYRLRRLASDAHFRANLERLAAERENYLRSDGWYGSAHADNPIGLVAYFSMEFGISDVLPIYAGGLGILAGDTLKTASDLAVPMVAVGLLYQEGYFRQALDASGNQLEAYPSNMLGGLALLPAHDGSGGWLRVPVELPGRTVMIRVWQVQVGRVNLYLLDSNDLLNLPADRGITGRLYDAQPELRLQQEIVLGIGGWRAIQAIGLEPSVCHMNEGHAALAALERIAGLMRRLRLSFNEALWVARAGNIFTTHTPVEAGFDRFAPELISRYLASYAERLDIPIESILTMGRPESSGSNEPFNTAFFAIRTSGYVNAVSRLHAEVSRKLFSHLFPRRPEAEVPVTHVTNGVHMASWDSEDADALWTRSCGKERWTGPLSHLRKGIAEVPDADIWTMRNRGRRHLVQHARHRLARQLGQRGASPEMVEAAQQYLDPDVLTFGFARRFAVYKRPNLLLRDWERLEAVLTDQNRPVQLIVGGKAHPNDDEGKRFVREFFRFANRSVVRGRCVFLEDYDILLAQYLAMGVDVWINTPRRPWEACGTSGMKVLVNGGLNVSELDGWWAEAYMPEAGWAIGDGREHQEPEWDAREADQLLELIEQEIIPQFYQRDSSGIPRAWIARIRASMSELAPRFSSTRMLQEYVTNAYIPAAAAFVHRSAKNGEAASKLATWYDRVVREWPKVRFGTLEVTGDSNCGYFQVGVYLGAIKPSMIAVELYANPLDGNSSPERIPMNFCGQMSGTSEGWIYKAVVESQRPHSDYTPRVIPYNPAAMLPLEAPKILWFQ